MGLSAPRKRGNDRGLYQTGTHSRAQSEVIGVVLIVGMVVISATLLTFSASSVLTELREGTSHEASTNVVEEMDTKISSVSSLSGQTQIEFSAGDDPNRYHIVQSGFINVSVNRNANCTAHIPLTSIRYEDENNEEIIYEAGGIWRRAGGTDNSAMHTPPDLTFDSGTLSLTVINVSGEIVDEENLVRENVTASNDATQEIRRTLFEGECARPDNVTLTVRSPVYQGWSRYLNEEIDPSTISTFAGNQTVIASFGQNRLPEETDDTRNDVVDLTSDSFHDVELTNTSVKVNKSANNTYTVIVTPLTSGSTQVGEIRVVDSETLRRPPLDIVFVMDESGSMDGSKMQNAKEAAKTFVGKLNASFDRTGLVGFTAESEIKVTANGEYVTNDFSTSGINGSIEDLSAGGSTDQGAGIYKSNVMFGLLSNSSRHKVAILLSDGKNSEGGTSTEDLNQKAFDMAAHADKQGITIHSIGFGNPDNETLETIANTTGGTYRYVDDASDLSEVFVDLFAEITESKQIVRDPLTMELQAGGVTYTPQIDGETSHIANTSDGNLNLNDPQAPSSFSYSIDVSDGENVTMASYAHDCDEWEVTDFVYENKSTGNQYAEVRCTDIIDSSVTKIDPSNVTAYVDGDDVSSLLSEPSDWWQEDLQNETLASYLEADNETLDLNSNEAIFVFRYPDGDNGVDRFIVHYEIGESAEEAIPWYVFNVEVRYMVIGETEVN